MIARVFHSKAVALAGCVLVLVAMGANCRRAAPPPPPAVPAVVSDSVAKALAAFNRGAALIEKYQYRQAAEAFEEVLKLAPDWQAARFNLALAHFNLESKEHLEAADRLLKEVLQADPQNLHARFTLGLLYQHNGENAQALECFERVHQADPVDAHVAYKYAEALLSLGRNEEGTEVLAEAVEKNPGLNSAVYRLAQQYSRMKQPEKAKALLARFRELNDADLAEGAFTVLKVYGYAGKYYMALGADSLPLAPAPASPAPKIVFSPQAKPLGEPVADWTWEGGSVHLPGLAAGDVDGDGDLDLAVTALGTHGSTAILVNDGSGSFAPGPMLCDKGVCPCFGDVDNDGDLDLWLGRAGADAYFANDGKGTFAPGPPPAQNQPEHLTACARLLDLDSDGDLDFAAFRLARGSVPASGDSAAAPSSIYNNNRDGSFADLAPRLGLALEQTPVAALVADDFDSDRDLDLVIFPAGDGEPIAWVNGRVWEHQLRGAAATGLSIRRVVGATTGDADKNGQRDLLVFTGAGVALFLGDGRFRFQPDQAFSDRFGRLGGTGGQFADLDNDGDLDLVIADAHRPDGTRGPALLVNDWPQGRFLDAAELDPGFLFPAVTTGGDASAVVADFTGDGRCDVVLAAAGQSPVLLENATAAGHWIAIDLAGVRGDDKLTRSNNSAIGARVEVKTGTVFQQYVLGVPSGPVAMPPLRVHAGLGANPKLEWLRVIWPDGVLQSEVELAADQAMPLAEVQRKESSCPHLFAWTGQRFEFVADFGGVGGLGYFVAPGRYAVPDPTEYLPLPSLEPRGGEYVFQVLEPLQEVVYLDEAKLLAVDHPAGTQVAPCEMAAVAAPPPCFRLFCYERAIDPVRAVDDRGADVTDALLQVDRRYAGASQPDQRFLGFAREHFVELDFGDQLERVAADARLVLLLHGWVRYGYSSVNFAASQAGLRLKAPSIHVLRDGQWVELFHEVGYPAGLRHLMALDMSGKLQPGDRRIRIFSNMDLYWDRIHLAVDLGEALLSVTEVPAAAADLHFYGYPREYSPDGREPNLYDYASADSSSQFKRMAGDYTRYGDVGDLLYEADDCYVILGHGDQVTLRFPAAAFPPVPEGCQRSFLLKTDSFCKDMDLYTAWPDTVEPLPFHAMSGYPYGPGESYPDNHKTRQYRRQYNTRRVLSP